MLEKIYRDHTPEKLIEIIETPQAYRKEAIQAAQKELNSRSIIPSSVEALAQSFWQNYTKTHFKTIIAYRIPLKSAFLQQETLHNHLRDAYDYHRERQELFEIDLTKYWAVF